MGALIGKKLGMTQVYNDKEELVPVTVVAAGPCPVVQVRSQDENGYDALQLAFEEIPARKVNKPETGHFSKAGVLPHRVLREFRQMEGDFEVGQVLDVSQFEVGQQVKVTGRSKGKGFAGVVKRYGFRGKNSTHGTPDRVRHGGSIGQALRRVRFGRVRKCLGRWATHRYPLKG